jgi:spore maturation protein CgeB
VHIVLVADFHPERLGASWQRACVANQIKVTAFDVREKQQSLGLFLKNRILHRLSIRSYGIRCRAARKYNQGLIDFSLQAKPDAVVFHNGDFIFPETVQALQSAGIRCALYHADNPLPPHYANRPETLPVARLMDRYFVWSEKLVFSLKQRGVANACFMPFAWDEEVFPYDAPPEDIWQGVLFIGGWDEEREAFLNSIAEHVPLKIYGPSYWGERSKTNSRSRQCWMGSDLRGAEAAKLIRESAVCINILRTQHIIDGQPDGLIMRHFEVPGAGGFLLSTRSGGATRLFPEGETAEYFANTEECMAKIRHFLANPEQRKKIALAAHANVASLHTYEHRLRELVEWLQSLHQGTRSSL